MMIGARRPDHQIPQETIIHVSQFEQFDIGRVAEERLDQRDQSGHHHRHGNAAGDAETQFKEELEIERFGRQ